MEVVNLLLLFQNVSMSNPKVLYVEDEIFLAKIVSETLQIRGYEVTLESDGAKVLS